MHAVTSAVERTLADLSAREIADALGVRAPLLRACVEAIARVASSRLGRALARFDARIGEAGIARAARETLAGFGAQIAVSGELARDGAALVVTNHPGAYDTLALMAGLGRRDVAFVAADRPLLRALPHLGAHLIFIDEHSPMACVSGVRRALDWLARGHVLVQYGAGSIEPDARFDECEDDQALGAWGPGTGVLAAHAPSVVPVFVSGVHSPRAKRLRFVRWAERRGTTTIAPLVQATVPGFRDVVVDVRIGTPVDLAGARNHQQRTALIRAAVARLRGTSRCIETTSAETTRNAAHSSRARHEEQS